MSSDNVEKLSAIIPEAWYDLIDRVVPGTVIVLASFPTDLVSRLSGLSLGGFAVGLVVVYVVGFVFDIVSAILFDWVFTNRKLREKIDKLPSPRREVAGKMTADGAMFRSLGFYLLLQCFLAISTWLYGDPIPWAPLREIRVHPLPFSLVFAAIAFVCWARLLDIVTGRLKSWESTPSAKTKVTSAASTEQV